MKSELKDTKYKKLFSLAFLALLSAGMFVTSCKLSVPTDDPVTPEETAEQKLVYSNATAFVPGTTSVEQAENMAIGWNLGNTFDAGSEGSKTNLGLGTETFWGMPKTTKAMIDAVQAAGFKTIRIPVSWHNHITNGETYTIDSAWMSRVKTVVDWAIDSGMCVILNVHHDNMSISALENNYGFALAPESNTEVREASVAFLTSVWTQIATTFSSYGNNLVFEVMNEPRDIGGEWEGNEWWCNNTDVMDCITYYEEQCIDTIRGISGNEDRFLMVPGYAASGSDKTELAAWKMPNDSSSDRLLLSAHAYSPYAFAMSDGSIHTQFTSSDKSDLDSIFSYLNTRFVSKGIGVVMGEASATDKHNLTDRVEWAKYYYTKARALKIPVVLWDNNGLLPENAAPTDPEKHGWFNRSSLTWYFPTVIRAMMNTVYDDWDGIGSVSDSGSTGGDSGSETVLFSGSYVLDWAINETIPSSKFASATTGSKLVFETKAVTPTPGYINIKLQTSDWGAVFYQGEVTGGTMNVKDAEGVIVPTSASAGFTYTPTAAEWNTIKSKGLLVYGIGIEITKITLK